MRRYTNKLKPRNGFTLIEILLVIGIIAILAAIVIIAINPARQLAQARNAQRWADINAILNAVYQYTIDNNGTLPSTISTDGEEICATNATSCTGLVDLSVLTDNEAYLVSIPIEPLCPPSCDSSGNGVGYEISKDSYGRVTVEATEAELSVSISATR
jgi:prepilin-type N-terminal cleavage/methylation domain-containing protein